MSWHMFGGRGTDDLTKPQMRDGHRVPVVYIDPGDPECRRTLDAFTRAGVEIERVDIAVDHEVRHALELTVHVDRLPVVDTGARQWSGHRADLIRAFVESEAGVAAQEAS
ncbi:glutaredoxin family protein [Mycobacteroides abscessus]|uniref:glutaredoxin family protein n=1 Tax=Mycobacteroides abscessus TaxID=36809 RepID=UPI0009A6D34D|nr:glutaredoxin family protein [Mycobacteroides abscessus]SKK30237.1 ribonucleoside-diphosphate reductase class Ib glutaredoxin subunit [Mycobacteroides abscessus subsp. abscessus]